MAPLPYKLAVIPTPPTPPPGSCTCNSSAWPGTLMAIWDWYDQTGSSYHPPSATGSMPLTGGPIVWSGNVVLSDGVTVAIVIFGTFGSVGCGTIQISWTIPGGVVDVDNAFGSNQTCIGLVPGGYMVIPLTDETTITPAGNVGVVVTP